MLAARWIDSAHFTGEMIEANTIAPDLRPLSAEGSA